MASSLNTSGTKGTGVHHTVDALGYSWSYTTYTKLQRMRWARFHSSTRPSKKLALLSTRLNSQRCVSAANHHTADQYSKTGRTKPLKYLSRSDWLWNTRQFFPKKPSLWETTGETERRCFSTCNLSNVSLKILKSTDFLRTAPSYTRVNVRMHISECIWMTFVFFMFNFQLFIHILVLIMNIIKVVFFFTYSISGIRSGK